MKQHWNTLSIFHKLFITLFGGIGLIIIVLLSYLWGHESNIILKKEQDTLQHQSSFVARELDNHLTYLDKELRFMTHLEVMDDMVVRDMDRRITAIMKQKADDLGESIVLFGLSPDFRIHASSHSTALEKQFRYSNSLLEAQREGKSHFFVQENLYLFSPIYGSFYTKDLLGYVIMLYPMKNFHLRLNNKHNLYQWLTPPINFIATYPNAHPNLDMDEYLHDSILLEGVLHGWTLHYAMTKKEALGMLYHFQTLFLSVFGIGLVLIAGLVWIILLRVIEPLRELSNTARFIAATGDYTQTVVERSNDEIGVVARSFNALMYATRLSMERIEILGKREAVLQTKSSFLSSMSHELRTPLGSILSLTQYLMTQPQTPEPMCETLGKIENSAHHLLGVINNVLDLAKAEAGKIISRPSECDLEKLIEDTVDLVYPLAEDKGLELIMDIKIPTKVFKTDTRLFSQILINLLSNSIKYTPQGRIYINLHVNHDMSYTLTIKDTGCGIASDALEHLFDEFYQVESKITDTLRGSGLGLAISQKISRLLHGNILIESAGEGYGTTAYFSFESFS